jgi:hypothetical protein
LEGNVAGSGFDGVERQGDAVEILQHGSISDGARRACMAPMIPN